MDFKAHIKSRDLRQNDIAKKLGVSKATISRWINRRAVVPTEMVRLFAEAIGVPVEGVLPPGRNAPVVGYLPSDVNS